MSMNVRDNFDFEYKVEKPTKTKISFIAARDGVLSGLCFRFVRR